MGLLLLVSAADSYIYRIMKRRGKLVCRLTMGVISRYGEDAWSDDFEVSLFIR